MRGIALLQRRNATTAFFIDCSFSRSYVRRRIARSTMFREEAKRERAAVFRGWNPYGTIDGRDVGVASLRHDLRAAESGRAAHFVGHADRDDVLSRIDDHADGELNRSAMTRVFARLRTRDALLNLLDRRHRPARSADQDVDLETAHEIIAARQEDEARRE